VHGFILDSASQGGGAKAHAYAPLVANVTVAGSNWSVASGRQFGEYFRPLAPGKHLVRVSCAGYSPGEAEVVVPGDGSGTVANFMLRRLSSAEAGEQQAAQGQEGSGQDGGAAGGGGAAPEDATAAALGGKGSGGGSRSGSTAAGGEAAQQQQQQQQQPGHLVGPSQIFGTGLGAGLVVLAVVVAVAAVAGYRHYVLTRQPQQQQLAPSTGPGPRLSPSRLGRSSESASLQLPVSHKPLM
jgi:hypothetical protein